MRSFTSSIVLAGIGVMFSSRLVFADCTKDVDCKGTRVCVQGACVEAAPPTAAAPVVVSPPPPPTAPRMVRRSQGAFVGGIVTVSLVPVALSVLLLGYASKQVCQDETSFDWSSGLAVAKTPDCSRFDATIYGGAAASVVFLGAGLAMLLYGVKKVPAEEVTTSVRPWISGTSGGVGVTTSF